jgi:chaperonin GroES
MTLIPLGDKVIVKRTEAEETTVGGIVLPDAAREKPAEGRVLSVGDGTVLKDGSRLPLRVSEGDRVLFSNWAGEALDFDDQELLILSESDILAVYS